MERFLSTEYFSFEDDKKIPIEINDETFETNIATLNFIGGLFQEIISYILTIWMKKKNNKFIKYR